MDIITMARELGKAIQQSQLYKDLETANEVTEKSVDLQKKLDEFSELRTQLNKEIMKTEGDKDTDLIGELDNNLRKLYDDITNSPEMIAYNAAKKALESELSFINQIITGSANGENPDLIERQVSCSGSCSTCGGCH